VLRVAYYRDLERQAVGRAFLHFDLTKTLQYRTKISKSEPLLSSATKGEIGLTKDAELCIAKEEELCVAKDSELFSDEINTSK
jgi:hypothetical protein